MRIYFRTNDSDYGSVDVYSPNSKRVMLMAMRGVTGTPEIVCKARTVLISGTSITTVASTAVEAYLKSGASAVSANMIYIIRVEAWNG